MDPFESLRKLWVPSSDVQRHHLDGTQKLSSNSKGSIYPIHLRVSSDPFSLSKDWKMLSVCMCLAWIIRANVARVTSITNPDGRGRCGFGSALLFTVIYPLPAPSRRSLQ